MRFLWQVYLLEKRKSCSLKHDDIREAVKNYIADFSPPPPTALTENHFAKKPLADRGGTPPPPLNGQSPKIFLTKWAKKG